MNNLFQYVNTGFKFYWMEFYSMKMLRKLLNENHITQGLYISFFAGLMSTDSILEISEITKACSDYNDTYFIPFNLLYSRHCNMTNGIRSRFMKQIWHSFNLKFC